MKRLRYIIIILIMLFTLLTCIKACMYVNLKISEKYETQLEGLTESSQLKKAANDRAIEIEKNKKKIQIQVSIFLVLLIIMLIYLGIKKRT